MVSETPFVTFKNFSSSTLMPFLHAPFTVQMIKPISVPLRMVKFLDSLFSYQRCQSKLAVLFYFHIIKMGCFLMANIFSHI